MTLNDQPSALERLARIDQLVRGLRPDRSDPERFHVEKDEALKSIGRLRRELTDGAVSTAHSLRAVRSRIAGQNLAKGA